MRAGAHAAGVDLRARLLVLEKLSSPDSRAQYLAERGTLRGRPTANTYRAARRARQYKGDLKASLTGGGGEVLEMSDYDTVALHVPYGPGWDAKRIEKLVFRTVSLPLSAWFCVCAC